MRMAGIESSREPVRIGVIGAGFIAQVAHLYALSRIPEARVVALAEPDDGLREAVSRRFRIQSAFCAYQEMLDRSDIEALVICVPRRAQFRLVTKALSGARAVLSEKPMAMTLEEATKMVSIAEHSGASWTVGYMKRYDVAAPPHVRRGGSRKMRYPEAPIAPDSIPEPLRGAYEYTLNVASHDINLLRGLFGGHIKPGRFLIRSNSAQRMFFEAGEFWISLVVAPVDIGRWDQGLDVTF